MTSPREVTQVLREARSGDRSAADRLFPLVYDELNRLAHSYLRNERPDHTLQATAVVHEAYIRLIGSDSVEWKDRAHFFALAARAMRRVLIDHARGHGRQKRGGGWDKIPLEQMFGLSAPRTMTGLLDLHDALERLDTEHADAARVVELKFFGGLTNQEIAEVMGKSTSTVERLWAFGRAWLYRALTAGQAGTGGAGA